MKYFPILMISLVLFSTPSHAGKVVSIYSQKCEHGVHKQPESPFALHVFCDDALGTNVSVFMDFIGAPFSGKYFLGNRFWQGEEWNYDVTSYSWLKENYLLLATSGIYGTGAIYKLNLENQTYKTIKSPDSNFCIAHLKSVEKSRATIRLIDCKTLKEKIVEIAL